LTLRNLNLADKNFKHLIRANSSTLIVSYLKLRFTDTKTSRTTKLLLLSVLRSKQKKKIKSSEISITKYLGQFAAQ